MIGVDTNLLIAWLNSAHPGHLVAKLWFESQSASTDLVLCELVLTELYGLLRNPKLWASPLLAPAAVAMIQTLRQHPHWELVDYPGGLMGEIWPHASAPQFAYRRIYDARLALTLRHHGVTEFATANVKDFQDFGFTRVWNPLA
jgi:toxin-antitoxin system PIN domain toxin